MNDRLLDPRRFFLASPLEATLVPERLALEKEQAELRVKVRALDACLERINQFSREAAPTLAASAVPPELRASDTPTARRLAAVALEDVPVEGTEDHYTTILSLIADWFVGGEGEYLQWSPCESARLDTDQGLPGEEPVLGSEILEVEGPVFDTAEPPPLLVSYRDDEWGFRVVGSLVEATRPTGGAPGDCRIVYRLELAWGA
jgi:hypothetical protein